MIRSTWMQFRAQAVVATSGLLIVAVVMAITGPHLVHLYDANVSTCAAHDDCSTATSSFLQNDHVLQVGLNVLAVVLPGIIGILWGAPLVARELAVSYTHLRAHETDSYLVCRLLLEKKK